MLSFNEIVTLKKMFENNQNIIQYIKSNTSLNAEEAILHSYDLQSGSYLSALKDQKQKLLKEQIGIKLAGILKNLQVECVCEVGVGEATTLQHVLSSIEINKKFAFDISLSRLLYGQRYLAESHLNVNLFCSELLQIPFFDNAIECVYSFHSIEPNGGKEKLILTELLRVSKNYLILIEPDYDMFGEEQKQRMEHHGYCKHLYHSLLALDADVICYEPWELDSNPLNKASLIIVKKKKSKEIFSDEINFSSPISYHPLMPVPEGYFCKEDGFLFPTIKNIPILLRKNAILASHYGDFL